MADFAAVLKKTIDGLKDNTPEMRRKVYDKARATIEAKLAAVTPPPPAALADRQRQHLEDAIASVEADYAEPPAPAASIAEPEPEEDGLDRVLADLDPRTIKPAPPLQPPLVTPRDEAAPRVEPGITAEDDGLDEAPEWLARPQEVSYQPPRRRRRRSRAPIAALIVLLLIVGAAGAAWLNRDALDTLPGFDKVAALFPGETTGSASSNVKPKQAAKPATTQNAQKPAAETPKAEEKPQRTAKADTTASEPAKAEKFTQRLTESGEEVDEGPANGEATVGEGTSVASASEAAPQAADAAADADAPASPAGTTAPASQQPAASDQQQVPVGQKAIFYEERTNAAEGSAETGNVVWTLVQESPGDDLPPEPAIRGEATIPGKNLQLRITIKRNADKSLPASHIVEMIFLTPDDFPGGGIDNVLRISMKHSEQDTGNPLLGIPAKIADGFFLFALNDSKAEEQTNLLLMKRQEWIDIPLVYKSGRRALITMEKGIPGDKVFDEALEAWSKETSG